MKKRLCAMLALLALVLTGCAVRASRVELPPAEPVREVRVIRPQREEKKAALYIGMAGEYTAYPYAYEGEVTPDQLIAAIGDLTGWDLGLDGPVLRDSSGITVTFAADCALFTGPPEPQKEEFFTYDQETLCAMLLDSMCHTLQWNAVNPKLEDPRCLPVYFRTARGDLALEEIGFTQPEDLPYGGLVPGAQVCSGQGRFLRMPSAEEAVFELDGEEVSVSLYDEDVTYTLSQVTPGRVVTVVYLQAEDGAVLTGVYT